MSKSIDEINSKIRAGKAVVLTASEVKALADTASPKEIAEKVDVVTTATFGPVCSSGTIGHSISYGKADAVTVICDDCSLADAYATAIANKVKSKNDIEIQLNTYQNNKDIKGLCIIVGDAVGYQGDFDLIF